MPLSNSGSMARCEAEGCEYKDADCGETKEPGLSVAQRVGSVGALHAVAENPVRESRIPGEMSARLAVELHCAAGLPDAGGMFSSIVAEIALETDGTRLAAGRLDARSTPVWAGLQGSCLVFELEAPSDTAVVDVSTLEVVVDLWRVSATYDERLVATARCVAGHSADGLPRDVPLKTISNPPEGGLFESLFWRDPRREPVPGVSLDDVLDGACPQLTLSVHCDSALNPVAVAYAPPSSVCEVDAPATATPSDGAFTYSSR